MERGKKYAVLLCVEEEPEYVKKKYGGYFGVFVNMLAEEGEIWRVFHVAGGEFPADDDVGDFDGYVITGSCSDSHANHVWICKLLNLINNLHSINKKVLGICFGHQILGRALGGKTGRATSGWDIGVTHVRISSSTPLKLPPFLHVIECHRDEIRELPEKAEIMAWSDKTGIEMFRYGDHMMGIQGHPEYTKDIILHLIDRFLQRHIIPHDVAIAARAKLEEVAPDREAWKKLCTRFLKGTLFDA